MATIKRFEDIKAWQKARELSREVYRCSKVGPLSRDFALRDQTRRAAISVMSNIAEGFERGGTREFMQFLAVAKGSVGEVEAQFYVALDEGYVSAEQFAQLRQLATSAKRLIGALISYLHRSGMKGARFQTHS